MPNSPFLVLFKRRGIAEITTMEDSASLNWKLPIYNSMPVLVHEYARHLFNSIAWNWSKYVYRRCFNISTKVLATIRTYNIYVIPPSAQW